MQMLRSLLPVVFLALTACQALRPVPTATPTAVPATPTDPPPTATSAPTATPVPSPTLALPTLAPAFEPSEFEVRTHPDGGLFPGDLVSFEVIGPQDAELTGEVFVVLPDGAELGPAGFGGFGIGGRRQATLRWAWDTAGLEAGRYDLRFEVRPGGPVFTETVVLLPFELHAYPEPDATWALAEIDCCLVYYVTGSAAERDLDFLLTITDTEADLALAQMGGELTEAIEIVFLPRVLGHGGFAGGEIYISYLDRNYAGNAPGQVIHHEIIHILDGRLGGDFRPSIFVEGLAVLLSGGHFKQEPIVPRAAALLNFDGYLPLEALSNAFYFAQHEISYLQAAALVQFMVDTWGWEAFDNFYRSIEPHSSNLPSAAIDQALQVHFSISYAALEADFLAFLEAQPVDPADEEDIRLTVDFFDTVRRYQQALDRSAYFLTAWLIGIDAMLERNVTADYVRHPSGAENIALETMLVSADRDLRDGDYAAAGRILDAVNAVLERIEAGDETAFYADPLAADHLAITLAVLGAGWEPQIIRLDEGGARVWATQDSFELVEFRLIRTDAGWEISS